MSYFRIFKFPTLLLAGASAFSMSTLFSAMKPVLLTRFVEQAGFGESLAGLIVAMPYVGIALSSLILNRLLGIMPLRLLVIVFGTLLTTSEFASAYLFETTTLIIPLQFLAGISVGVLTGGVSRIIATKPLADEMFGFVDMAAVFLMSFMIAGVGAAIGAFGLEGGYLFAAVVSFIYTLIMLVHRSGSDNDGGIVKFREPLKFALRPISVIFMGMLFVTCSGFGFAFLFTIAIDLGMDYASAGSFIGTLVLASALACQLGGWCSGKFGPYRPLAGAYIVCGIGWYIAINADSQLVFMAALVPAIFSLQFNFPILLALSGSLDKEGQWAAIATPLLMSGFAWAAITAGAIVTVWGIPALATATGAGLLVCLLLLIPSREKVQ
ncbi:MAG: hypothetical protein ACJAVI_004419 [Candidatus Azotimanducaceae bacterium]|jgi:hypothetical protein